MKVASWSLVALGVAPALVGLANGLQDVDPAQYADVARRMLESGNWLDLRDMNGPFINKPPMMLWAQAALMSVFGVGDLAARLPALLFGFLAMVGTFWVGRQLKDSRLGAIAAAFVASSTAFQLMVADPKVDMPLMAFTTLAIAATLASRQRPSMMWAAWAFAGCAVLSKGPVGLALPMLAVAPELVRDRWLPGASLARRVFSVRPIRGLFIVALIVSPFYVALALHQGPEAARYMLWQQSVGRLNGTSEFRDTTTPLFYLHTSLWAFLPFVPLTIAALIRRAARVYRARRLPFDVSRVVVWWLFLPLILISSSIFKLPQYLYWITPAAALLAADEVLVLGELAARRWVVAGWVLAAGVFIVVWLTVSYVFPASLGWLLLVAAIPFVVGLLRGRVEAPERVAFSLVASVAGGMIFFHGLVSPSLIAYQPYEAIGQLLRREEPTRTEIPVVALAPSFALAFYARRDARYMSPFELRDAVLDGGPRLVVFGPELPIGEFEAVGLRLTSIAHYDMYPTSRARWAFLNTATRANVLMPIEIMKATVSR